MLRDTLCILLSLGLVVGWAWPSGISAAPPTPTGAPPALSQAGLLTLLSTEYNLSQALLDAPAGYAYFSLQTTEDDDARIIKVRLADFTRVATLTLTGSDGAVGAAVIDPAAGYAYFSVSHYYTTQDTIITRIRLSDFTPMGSLTLADTDFGIAALDALNGYAYFGGSHNDVGAIQRIRLSDFTVDAELTLYPGEGWLVGVVLDQAQGFAYFSTALGKIIRIQLSDFTHAGRLHATSNYFTAATLGPIDGFAYFASYNEIIRIRLSDFTLAGLLTLGPPDTRVTFSLYDQPSGFAYFATQSYTVTRENKIFRVRMSDFTTQGELSLPFTDTQIASGIIDPNTANAYFGTRSSDGARAPTRAILRIHLPDLTYTGSLPLQSGQDNVSAALLDSAHAFAYFLVDSPLGKQLVQIHLTDFTPAATFTFADDQALATLALDPDAGLIYAALNGTTTTPPKIVRIRVPDLTAQDELTLPPPPETARTFAASKLDPAHGFGYFAINDHSLQDPYTPNCKIARIRLTDFTLADEQRVISDTDGLWCSSIATDPQGTALYMTLSYVTASGYYTRLIRLDLASWTVTNTLDFNQGGWNALPQLVALDLKYAYILWVDTLLRVQLSDFTLAGSLPANLMPHSVVLDAPQGFLYFFDDTKLNQIRLSDFTYANALPLEMYGYDAVGILDPAAGYAYWGTYSVPAHIYKIALDQARPYLVYTPTYVYTAPQ